MKRTHQLRRSAFWIVLSAALVMVWPAMAQQHGQHQTQQMQHQMQQTHEMMQQMTRLMDRSHAVSRNMNQYMNSIKGEANQERFQNMYRMNEQLGGMAGQMKNAMERYRLMLEDGEMLRDREMNQEMERLHKHLGEMSGDMDEALKAMERLTKRFREHQPDGY